MKFSILTLTFMLCFGIFTLAPQKLSASDEVTKTEFADSMSEMVAKFKAADFENMSKRDQRRFMRSNMKDMVKHGPHMLKHQEFMTPRMRRGIYLVIIGLVISIIGSILWYGPRTANRNIYWLFSLIGSILILIGGIMIVLELLENL